MSNVSGDPIIDRAAEQPAPPFVLIVEPDRTTARRMMTALGGDCAATRRAADGNGEGRQFGAIVIIESLRELFDQDLEWAELVICAVELPDGTGLNALDYLRGHCPHVPVILMGSSDDAAVAVEAIRAGALDFLTSTGHDMHALPLTVEKCLTLQRVKHENERLQRDLGNSLTELAVKNQQLQALVRQLEATVRTDDLTGLCNRRSLNEMLERAWQQAARNNRPLAFLMLDLDDFKTVNDRFGHLRGDEVLRETGKIIQANCRQVDVPARYGGDEFCVLMPESEAHEVVRVAVRILRECEVANRSKPEGEPRIGMSIGVAQINQSRPVNTEELIRHADEALYAAKASGKGRIMVRGHEGVAPVPTSNGDPSASPRRAIAW